MSDEDDVREIQASLRAQGPQAWAAMQACANLDDQTRGRGLDLAGRIVAYVSDDLSKKAASTLVAEGRALRTEFYNFLAELKAKGCGNVAAAVQNAPAPKEAPPDPHAPALKNLADPLTGAAGFLARMSGADWLVVAAIVYFATRRGR